MSKIKALEKLRKSSHLDDSTWTLENGEVIRVFNARPDDPKAVNWGEQWRNIADEVEAEIAERFMELPVDADGVPIWIGDAVEFGENHNKGIVKALNERMVIAMHVDSDYMNYAKYGLLWNADACRHVKERTVEDVLREYGEEYHKAFKSDYTFDPADIFRKYADEIRQMMGGDAE